MGQRLSCEQQEEASGLLIQLNAYLLPQLLECTDALFQLTWWNIIKKIE